MGQTDYTCLLKYDIGEGAEAFSTRRDSALPYAVTTARQIHGSNVALLRGQPAPGLVLDGYDAIVTDVKGLAIGVRTADCVPVLMYDRMRGVVAAVHSGWRGTALKICQKAVFSMKINFGTDPGDIVAVLGPSIGRQSFQVGEEVVGIMKGQGFPLDKIWYFVSGNAAGDISKGHHVDLKEANRILLEDSGVPSDHIYDCGIDSFTDRSFFSARRETAATGRTISSVMLL